MKLQYCLTGLLCLFLKSDAQQIKPLTIGDKAPGVAIKNIYNYPALQSRLSSFNNKLLILDFMATNCSSCLKALPAFDSLQKQFGKKIQFLLVTTQPADKVKVFLSKHARLNLPIVAADTMLYKMFPHTFISHEVWINNGIVKAITHPEYVTAGNIQKVIAGTQIDLPLKDDTDTCKKYSIVQLYLRTYGMDWYPAKQVVLEIKDSSRFFYNNVGYKEEWKRHNRFCLATLFSTPLSGENMRSTLDDHFHLHGRIENREVQCLVLRRTGKRAENISTENGLRKITKVAMIYALGETLLPVIDETPAGITHLIVNDNYLTDTRLLQQTLQRSGFELVPEAREIELLVISSIQFINQKK